MAIDKNQITLPQPTIGSINKGQQEAVKEDEFDLYNSVNKAQQAMVPGPRARPSEQPPPDPAKQKDAERLRQRIAAKQFVLASLGIDWTPSDQDLEEEHKQLPPDGESIVQWREPPKKKEEKRLVDFEPFQPDADEEGYLRVDLAQAEPEPTPQPQPAPTPIPEPPMVPPMDTTQPFGKGMFGQELPPQPTKVLSPKEGPGSY